MNTFTHYADAAFANDTIHGADEPRPTTFEITRYSEYVEGRGYQDVFDAYLVSVDFGGGKEMPRSVLAEYFDASSIKRAETDMADELQLEHTGMEAA